MLGGQRTALDNRLTAAPVDRAILGGARISIPDRAVFKDIGQRLL